MKATIITVGDFGQFGQPTGWEFRITDPLMPALEITAGGEIIYGGYTVQELKDIKRRYDEERENLDLWYNWFW